MIRELTIIFAAFGDYLGVSTYIMEETLALKIVVEWCTNNDIRKLEIECDSKLLVAGMVSREVSTS